MTNPAIFEDAFNLLCGAKLGSGIHRDVFECRLRADLVVKVERHDLRDRVFANAMEAEFWNDHQYTPSVARWLAPCETLSPDGRVLLQSRCDPLRPSDRLPDKLPIFLNDIKRENFGLLDGKIVCMDYALHHDTPNTRLRNVRW